MAGSKIGVLHPSIYHPLSHARNRASACRTEASYSRTSRARARRRRIRRATMLSSATIQKWSRREAFQWPHRGLIVDSREADERAADSVNLCADRNLARSAANKMVSDARSSDRHMRSRSCRSLQRHAFGVSGLPAERCRLFEDQFCYEVCPCEPRL